MNIPGAPPSQTPAAQKTRRSRARGKSLMKSKLKGKELDDYNKKVRRAKTSSHFLTKLTPQMHKTLCKNAKTGLFDKQVAIISGIHPSTLFDWLNWGLKDDAQDPFLSFAIEYLQCSIQTEQRWLKKIETGGQFWNRYAWLLEHRYAGRWHNSDTAGQSQLYQIPEESNRDQKALSAFRRPSPALLKIIQEAGMQLVPIPSTSIVTTGTSVNPINPDDDVAVPL